MSYISAGWSGSSQICPASWYLLLHAVTCCYLNATYRRRLERELADLSCQLQEARAHQRASEEEAATLAAQAVALRAQAAAEWSRRRSLLSSSSQDEGAEAHSLEAEAKRWDTFGGGTPHNIPIYYPPFHTDTQSHSTIFIATPHPAHPSSNLPPCLLPLLRLEAQSAKAASLADAARSRVADLERRAAEAKRLNAAAAARGDAGRLLALRRAQQQAAAQKAQLER